VVCGDFNIDRDSSLFAGFVQDTGLSGVFKGDCLPAFHAEYLPLARSRAALTSFSPAR
jgi:hypothetical protein